MNQHRTMYDALLGAAVATRRYRDSLNADVAYFAREAARYPSDRWTARARDQRALESLAAQLELEQLRREYAAIEAEVA